MTSRDWPSHSGRIIINHSQAYPKDRISCRRPVAALDSLHRLNLSMIKQKKNSARQEQAEKQRDGWGAGQVIA